MTYEVQQTRWDRIIRRVSGSIGPGSRVSETLSELFPMVDVEQVPGELLILGGTQLAFGGFSLAASVGEINKWQLVNPADSGNLVILEKVIYTSAANEEIRWDITSTLFGAAANTQRVLDVRIGVDQLPVARVNFDQAAGGTNLTGIAAVTADVSFVLENENPIAILAPATAFQISGTTQNVASKIAFYWRERPALESELSL